MQESAIKSQIRKGLLRPQLKKPKTSKLLMNGKNLDGPAHGLRNRELLSMSTI